MISFAELTERLKITSIYNYLRQTINDWTYGVINKKGELITSDGFNIDITGYYVRKPEDIIKSKVGICWDACFIAALYLQQHNIDYKIFFRYIKSGYPKHSIVVFKYNNMYYCPDLISDDHKIFRSRSINTLHKRFFKENKDIRYTNIDVFKIGNTFNDIIDYVNKNGVRVKDFSKLDTIFN